MTTHELLSNPETGGTPPTTGTRLDDGGEPARQAEHWRWTLRGCPAQLALPLDRARPATHAYRQAIEDVTLPRDAVDALIAAGREGGSSDGGALLAAVATLLHRFSAQDDICIGAAIDGAAAPVVLRLDLRDAPSFGSLRQQAESRVGVAMQNCGLSFDELVAIAAPDRDPSHHPLYQVVVAHRPDPLDATGTDAWIDGLRATWGAAPTQPDLTILIAPTGAGDLAARFVYNQTLFDADTVAGMTAAFATLVRSIAAQPSAPIATLPLLPVDDHAQITGAWNDTARSFDGAMTLPALFEAQAARTPDRPAVSFAGEQITYAELNDRANRLGRHLRELGVGPETRVAVCLERSIEMLVALYGVHKAGGAYIPLNPASPPDRRAAMLRDSGAVAVLTQDAVATDTPDGPWTIVRLDTDWPTIARQDGANPAPVAGPDNVAYVIYTSGSTGTPKGALVTHRAIRNRLLWMQEAFPLTAHDRVLQKTPFTFDVSVWELFWPLLVGAELIVARPGGHRDPAYLVDAIADHEITTIHFVPSMLRAFLDAPDLDRVACLSRVICSGEALPPDLPPRFFDRIDAELHNLYGPTEAAVDVTAWPCPRDATGPVPIGRPIANVRTYILDAAMQPVPVGVPGELHLGGVQVGRGYLDRPALTADRFGPDPFGPEPGARLYRTGDLVRYRRDGVIEFLGRTDQQVKLRGFRIELGEIEAALVAHPSVSEAVATVRDDRLVGYVVPAKHDLDETALRRDLGARLPEHMVPTAFVTIDTLPLSPNGKIDRRLLPAPGRVRPELPNAYVEPRNPVEREVAAAWERVLRLDGIGVDDPFDRLGGGSLDAANVISFVRETFGVEIPFRLFFTGVTVADLAAAIESSPAGRPDGLTITPAPRPDPVPLSASQERVWFIQQLDRDAIEYSFPSALRFTGTLDVPALERTLTEIIRRQEIFRTSFPARDGTPVQAIHPPYDVELPVIDVPGDTPSEREQNLWRMLHVHYRRPFDITELPLVRWDGLYRLSETEHVLAHNEHHLVHDGWSFHVFLRELIEIYRGFSAGEPSPLPELPIQFADYAIWEREWIESDEAAEQFAFWREKLADAPTRLALPFDHPRPAAQTFVGSNRHIELPGDLCVRLRALGRAEGASFFMTVTSTLFALLHRYTGQNDICLGIPTANRRFRETEALLGMIINNFVLRANLGGNPTFRELLRTVRDNAREAMANQELPFDRMVDAAQPDRTAQHNPLFQIMCGINDVPLDVAPLPDVAVRVHPAISNGSAKFDMAVVMFPHAAQWIGPGTHPDPDGVTCMIEYNTALFEHETIARVARHFETLLEAAVTDPDRRLSDMAMLDEPERDLLIRGWNDTDADYPADRCVHALVEDHAARSPGSIAVEYDGERLTYGELDHRANQLARHLHDLGVRRGTMVGVCLDRSTTMVVAMLAILKSGGAYVPLDPSYPEERLRFMLEDTAAPIVLTTSTMAAPVDVKGTRLVCLDTENDAIAALPPTAPERDARAGDTAYVIYTSGSTGRAKGVCVPHRAITRLVVNTDYVQIRDSDRIAQASNANFDAATFEIWGTLINGARLVGVTKDALLSPAHLAQQIRDDGINVMFVTTALFNELASQVPDVFATLRYVLFGGQAVDPQWPRSVLANGRPEHLLHVYGPTETTTFATWHEITDVPDDATTIPIGRAIANTRVYVLDADARPAPIGAAGELYVGGPGVARGYLNQPALTAEAYVPDPFSGEPGARLYRTGDLVRWTSAGCIEFIGRLDDQVKVRGFRIELGEIETTLAGEPGVRNAVVLCREDEPGQKRIVAYVVPDNGVAPDADAIRSGLRKRLPDYMMPTSFVLLDSIPTTHNGKIDRGALPAPDRAETGAAEFVAPSTPTEETLARIWCDVLGLERVGVHDHFFDDLAGHSLLGMQVVYRAKQAFGVELELRQMFEAPTIAGLAECVDGLVWLGGGAAAPDGADREEGTL